MLKNLVKAILNSVSRHENLNICHTFLVTSYSNPHVNRIHLFLVTSYWDPYVNLIQLLYLISFKDKVHSITLI
jgi:hypothetical protein